MPGYLPFANGRYDVGPGLIAFGQNAGLGPADKLLFQFDDTFPHYRAAKLEAREEDITRYYFKHELPPEVEAVVCRFIIDRLAAEWPARFVKQADATGQTSLDCRETGELLRFNSAGLYEGTQYLDALDALAFQMQEDLAIWRRDGRREWLAGVHLCFPNHWSPGEKIGRPFAEVHAPVAEFAKANRSPARLVDTFIDRGPFVRFAWGLATDTRLNHHPIPPANTSQTWTGRKFDPANPALFLRIERQTLWPFPTHHAALFTIRTYFRDVAKLIAPELELLSAAIASMTPASLQYKGLADSHESIRQWLKQLAT